MQKSPDELKINWISPGLPSDIQAAESLIRSELLALDLDDIYDLMFHTVFLDNGNMDGPAVTVTVSDEGDSFACWYDEKPEWIESGPLEEGPFEGFKVAMPRSVFDDEDK